VEMSEKIEEFSFRVGEGQGRRGRFFLVFFFFFFFFGTASPTSRYSRFCAAAVVAAIRRRDVALKRFHVAVHFVGIVPSIEMVIYTAGRRTRSILAPLGLAAGELRQGPDCSESFPQIWLFRASRAVIAVVRPSPTLSGIGRITSSRASTA